MKSSELFFTENAIAFVSVFVASLLMKHLSGFEPEIGSYLYLPIGAKILVFLLFGRVVLPGVIASCLFCGIFLFNQWGGHLYWGAIGAVVGAMMPLLAMKIIEWLRIVDFSDLSKIDFRHVLFLIFFASILHALSRFALYAKGEIFTTSPVDFITHYIVGDMIGSIVVIWTTLKILPALINWFAPKSA